MARSLSLLQHRGGAAAAEMALVTPLLIIIMFGTFELGNYFHNNHVVIKGVRDGARFASRRAFTGYTCTGGGAGTVDAGVISATQNVTRTGQIAVGGTPRLYYWTNAGTVTVTVDCTDNTGATYSGIYDEVPEVPVVRVTATVPYTPLVGSIGFDATGLQIVAESEVPVMGI